MSIYIGICHKRKAVSVIYNFESALESPVAADLDLPPGTRRCHTLPNQASLEKHPAPSLCWCRVNRCSTWPIVVVSSQLGPVLSVATR